MHTPTSINGMESEKAFPLVYEERRLGVYVWKVSRTCKWTACKDTNSPSTKPTMAMPSGLFFRKS